MKPEKFDVVKSLMLSLTRKATDKEVCEIGKRVPEIFPECARCGRIYTRGCLCHPVIECEIEATKWDLERMMRVAENAVASEGQVRGFLVSAEPPFTSKLSVFLDLVNERLLDCAQVAAYLRTSKSRLRKDRAKKIGPPYIGVCGRVFYFASDVMEWLENLKRESTQD